MKTIFFLTALLISCYGEEYPEETADLFKTKLWQEIQKRLFEKESPRGQTDHEAGLLELKDAGNDGSDNTVNHSPQCTRGSPNAVDSVVANTIIKTTDSVKSGAAFLASPKIASATECLDKCCQMSHCSLAVYENKKKNACYLFDCGNPTRCQFTDHANYTSIILKPAPRVVTTTAVPAAVPVENHVDALQGLVNQPETVPPTEHQPPRTTLPDTTRAPALPPTTTIQEIVQVKLFAACSRHEVCEDENAECSLEQFCVCKDGFTPKNGRCVLPEEPVSHCGRFQFECKSPNSYPRCIASYDRCDGVSQCVDGSDEADCSAGPISPETSEQERVWEYYNQLQSGLNDANKGNDKNKPVPGQAGSDRPDERLRPVETGPDLPVKMQSPRPPIVVITTKPQPTRPSPKVNVDQTFEHQAKEQPVPNTGHGEVQSHPDKTESQMIHPNQGKIVKEKVPQSARPQVPKQEKPIETGNQPETKSDLTAPKSNVDKSDRKLVDVKEPVPKVVSVTEPEVPKSKPAAASDVQVQAHVEVPDDSGSSFLFYGGSQGAIVALSLSLAITVILVLFLGCRLRTVKRRLKRGRVLTSNEADYLINGMYL